VSENMEANLLLEFLNRMPGVSMCGRIDPVTGGAAWRLFTAKAAALYEVSEAEARADPVALLGSVLPEDRARVDEQTAVASVAGATMAWTARVRRADGGIRWLETQTTFVHEADGAVGWYTQAFDVTERKQLEEQLVASERARAQADALHRAVIDALPVGVTALDTAGRFLVYNVAQQRMSGSLTSEAAGVDMMNVFGVFRADGVTPFPDAEMPIARAMAGEDSPEGEMVLRNAALQSERRLSVRARPLRDGDGNLVAALAVSQDITEQRLMETEILARNEALAASEVAKAALIDRLRYAIDELSNPILEVWDDVLVMPIIGVVDSRRTADMVQRLLAEVTRTQARFVIVDVTGVEIVDTKTADHLIKLTRKVEIVGARCVLTGIRPAVAETLVDIGVDFGRLATLRNLKHGLREALRVGRREREADRTLWQDDADQGAKPQSRPT